MKKILFGLMLILMVSNVYAATFGTTARADIQKYEPSPVGPGEKFELWIVITNPSNSALNGVTFEIVDEFPFSPYGDQGSYYLNRLAGNEDTTIKLRGQVDRDVVEGDNFLKLRMTTDKGTQITSSPLTIGVQLQEAVLSVKEITTVPDLLIPGGSSQVKIVLQNYADTLMKDITLKLDFSNMPISPIKSTSSKKIRNIPPGGEAEIIFDVMADADAESKIYQTPLILNYYDGSGKYYEKTNPVGLRVGSSADYDLNVEESDVLSKGRAGEVTISLSNIGPSELKYVLMELEDTKEYDVIGNRKIYLGNIESDDFETAEFKVYINEGKKEIPLQVKINYKDAYNQQYQETIPTNLRIYTSSEIRKYNLGTKQGSFLNTIFYILLVLFIYYTWKEWRKTKDLEQAVKIVAKRWFNNLKWRNLKRLPRKIRIMLK